MYMPMTYQKMNGLDGIEKNGNMVSDGYVNMLYGPYSKIKKGKYKLQIEIETIYEAIDVKEIAEVEVGTAEEKFLKAIIMSNCPQCEYIFEVKEDREHAEI